MLLILLALPWLMYLRLPIYRISGKHISESPHSCGKMEVMPFPVTLSSSKFSMWTLKNKYEINFCINDKALKSESFPTSCVTKSVVLFHFLQKSL